MKKRKCIAVVMAQPSGNYQSNILRGVFKKAFELDMNVAVIYTSTQSGCYIDAPEMEEQIFYMPDTDKFSGIVFMPDGIKFKNIDRIKEKYRKVTSCPVICLDIEEDGFTCLTTTDNRVIEDNIQHLYQCYQCTDIAYMTGIKGHPHAEARLEAYRSAMKKLGLEVSEDRVYYGDFWYNEGENFVKQLLDSPGGLPQAIVCASDIMAHSVCQALQKNGYAIPKDVIVTGYGEGDGEFDYISSTGKNIADEGYRAVEIIDEISKGIKYEVENCILECSSLMRLSRTCGCGSTEVLRSVESVVAASDKEEGYFSYFNNMRDTLQEVDDFYDFFWKADWHTFYIKPINHFSVNLCEGWFEPKPPRKYTENIIRAYVTEDDKNGDYFREVRFDKTFPLSEINPVLWEEYEVPRVFYIEPLYTKRRLYGYAVLSYGNEEKVPDTCYKFWLKDIMLGLEAYRRMYEIQELYAQMQHNAITNLMTGLYNRNGFGLISEEMLSEAKAKHSRVAVIMADMNCLKYINDTYGHEAGDNAIITAGMALSSVRCGNCDREENFRMGGDEFIKVIIGKINDSDLKKCIEDISAVLEKHNSSGGEYPVILSMGSAIGNADETGSVYDLVTPADKEMLINKAETKKKSGFDHKRKAIC